MKRILIAVLLLLLGAAAIGGLGTSTSRMRQECADNARLWQSETQAMAAARSRQQALEERVRLERGQLQSSQSTGQLGRMTALKPYFQNSQLHLFMDPAVSETLLSELGFNWNTTGDYLVISKATLFSLGMDGMKNGKLSDTAMQALAIQPTEKAVIDALAQQTSEKLRQWVTANVRREEPTEKDYLMQLTIPGSSELSQSMRSGLTNGLVTVLGPDRGQAMIRYAGQWMYEMCMSPVSSDPVVIQLHRIGHMGHGLESEVVVRRGGNVQSTRMDPRVAVPPIVSMLYPGGWEDLAAREGIELSDKFKTQAR
jgi:hypothetical protein